MSRSICPFVLSAIVASVLTACNSFEPTSLKIRGPSSAAANLDLSHFDVPVAATASHDTSACENVPVTDAQDTADPATSTSVIHDGSGATVTGVIYPIFPLEPLIPNVSIAERASIAGGSNFAFIKQHEFTNVPMSAVEQSDCTAEGGHRTGENRSVVGVYHRAKEQIDRKIQNLYRSGQRKISFVIWHFSASGAYTENMHCIALQVNGTLTVQHSENLKNLVKVAKKTGFDQINIRFAPVDQSAPSGWSTFNEDMFQSNWNLIVNSRRVVYDAINSTNGASPRVLFDLGLEIGGSWINLSGQVRSQTVRYYAKRLWNQYVQNFGAQDTIGFSIVPAHQEMVIDIVRLYDEGGARPTAYGFDVYGNMDQITAGDYQSLDQQFALLKTALTYVGDLNSRELFLQETYFSSPEWHKLLQAASARYGVPIRYVMQWPLAFRSGNSPQNVNSLAEFYY